MTTDDEHRRPAWRRRTRGEHRWPAGLAAVVAIGLQVSLPTRLLFGPRWILPVISLLLVVALALINPGRIDRHSKPERIVALTLTGVVSLTTAVSAARLAQSILDGSIGNDAVALLYGGAAVYVVNIIVFSLWYWEFDRGGPAARALGTDSGLDLLFPQMVTPDIAPKDWEPTYPDYLYLAFTNATAFSPTDVMPLHRWAKMTMMAQAVIALLLVVLVIARAINILR